MENPVLRAMYAAVALAGTLSLHLCQIPVEVYAQTKTQQTQNDEIRDQAGHQSNEIDRLYKDSDKQEAHIEFHDREIARVEKEGDKALAIYKEEQDKKLQSISNTVSTAIAFGEGISSCLFVINLLGFLDPLKRFFRPTPVTP